MSHPCHRLTGRALHYPFNVSPSHAKLPGWLCKLTLGFGWSGEGGENPSWPLLTFWWAHSIMLKFFRKHPPKEGEERERLKKELFRFQKCVEHGFPTKPSAMAYDSKLQLLAIGTKSGVIRVFGAPGFEVAAAHEGDVSVTSIFFIPEEGRLITACSDSSLHLWEINTKDGSSVLEEKEMESAEAPKVKGMSTCSMSTDSSSLFVGTEGGNVHVIDAKTLSETQVITMDVIIQNVPEDFKVNPGAVEAIACNPVNSDKVLIGFNRGLIVLWNAKDSTPEATFNATQQLESLTWGRSGEEFISAHNDGSYITWEAKNTSEPKEPALTPYGPFPCKAINKLLWKVTKNEPMVVFSGGMPRASYGDRHTVSIMQGADNHVVADLTSRVVDFLIISRADHKDAVETDRDDPQALIILAEEELVVLDLESEGWPAFCLPYLNSVHSSAITCAQHVSNVPESLWQKITDAGDNQNKNFSKADWPINGGRNLSPAPVIKDLLLTGHEDGTVRFWDASTSSLHLMYKLSTCPVFGIRDTTLDVDSPDEEEWPPFRKVGTFDPFSDDPRLAIQKLALCALSETLVAAGSAGQVLIFNMERQEREQDLKEVKVNVMADHEGFVWKGHEALTCKIDDLKYAAGFQPTCIMQLSPPAACTALALHSEWQLVAAGTGQGFAVLDYAQKKEVATRCTLNPNDLTGTSDSAMSRRKSLKKSLRESFRRLRRRRSEKRPKEEKPKKEAEKTEPGNIEETPAAAGTSEEGAAAAAGGGEGATAEAAAPTPAPAPAPASPAGGSGDCKPEERQVEARSADDSLASMVRSLYFADTFIVNGASHSPSLWVGTNGGHIFVYSLTVPPSDKRTSDYVSCLLAKEIRLKHHAPVLSMAVVDSKNNVLPDAFEVINERAKAADMEGQHSIIICSEEQLKAFSLPALKPRWKNKITAIDGARLRKIQFVNFRRDSDNYNEFDIGCLTNTGDLRVYSVSTLRRQLTSSSLRKEDINGIASFVFTKDGQGFYLQSPSEFARVTLSTSATNATPKCELELAEGLRPLPPEPEEPEQPAAVETPAVEVTPASETGSQEPEAAGEADVTVTSADDSNMDQSAMSADITVDSVRDVIAENDGTIVTSVRTITQTTTSTVSESSATATQDVQQAVTVTNGIKEDGEDAVTDVLRETQHEVTTRTSEFVTRTSEKTTHSGEEVIKQLSEMKMTTAVIEDPSLLKQKVLDSSMTTTTTTTNADGEVTTTTTTTTTNGTD
ncbi:lethal(2) giant larvae protein-like protein [Plakobranchus ocellatus]|uniref:Lethal(2) giant larvae protein-like protein n=1 Tax=Plakobranchus ocellatus TaxID=259542 RepID=A0AAV4D5F4_9GAST|nr:lethal(2) giant larvae protein-like protein [Plakobranchus ocellatus]